MRRTTSGARSGRRKITLRNGRSGSTSAQCRLPRASGSSSLRRSSPPETARPAPSASPATTRNKKTAAIASTLTLASNTPSSSDARASSNKASITTPSGPKSSPLNNPLPSLPLPPPLPPTGSYMTRSTPPPTTARAQAPATNKPAVRTVNPGFYSATTTPRNQPAAGERINSTTDSNRTTVWADQLTKL